MSKPRAGIYTRVSTTQQTEKFSLPAQEALLREYAEREGLDVVDHYQDAGISAKSLSERPEIQRLMQDCRAKRLDMVVAVELDRTTRNVEDMLTLTRFFKEHGILYRELDCEDTAIDTADGFLKRTIKSTISQYERMHIAERITRTKRHRAKQGKFQGGPTPYGFTTQGALLKALIRQGMAEGEAMQRAGAQCPEAVRLYPVEEEISLVQRVFAEYLRTNSLRQTILDLNAHGFRTRQGRFWSAESLRRILTNPVYLGQMTYDVHTWRDGKRKRNDKADWIVTDAEHKAVISQEMFDQVQALLAANQKPRRSGRVYLLSGLVKCGLCHGAMVGYSFKRNQRQYSYYHCNTRAALGPSVCPGVSYNADKLEAMIIEELVTRSSNASFLTDTQAHLDELRRMVTTTDKDTELARVESAIQATKRQLVSLANTTSATMQTHIQQLDQELVRLEETRARLREESNEEEMSFATVQASFQTIQNFWQGWESLTDEGKRKRLQAVIKEVRVTRDQIDLDLIVDCKELSRVMIYSRQNLEQLSPPAQSILSGFYPLSIVISRCWLLGFMAGMITSQSINHVWNVKF